MSAATSAVQYSMWASDPGTATRENIAARISRIAVIFCLLSLVFVAEYQQSGSTATKSIFYMVVGGGFRIIDVIVLCLALVHGFAVGCSRKSPRMFPRNLTLLISVFCVAIVVSMVYGTERGGQNLFFDWRAIALGIAFYLIYRFWTRNVSDARAAVIAFALVVSLHIGSVFYSYLAGQGASLLGIRIPLFDGPSISAFVFAALLGLAMFSGDSPSRHRWLWLTLSAGAMLLVALCFRRTYWAELVVGVGMLAFNARGRRLRTFALPLCMVVVAFAAMGTSFTDRLSSIDFTRDDVPYSEDNSDHVGDVLDAWAQVRAAPLMGIGLGTSYPTWHIRNWKEESVMVHNAPLHVWLKYGLLGLVLYLAYHLVLLRCLCKHAKTSPPQHRAAINAVFAYLAAQFIVSLGFTPWPYSAVQSTNLIAFLLAVAFLQEPSCHSQAFPLSPRISTAPNTSKTRYSA